MVNSSSSESPRPQVSLTVLVPVYNERFLVSTSLERLKTLEQSPDISKIQVIVVDDASTDGTGEVLRFLQSDLEGRENGKIFWVFLRHERNRGKGAAIQTALSRAMGDVTSFTMRISSTIRPTLSE